MVNNQLLEYIKLSMSKGYSLNKIRDTLINNEGLNPVEVDETINLVSNNVGNGVSVNKRRNKIIRKRNPFLVLLFSILTLGIYAIFWLVFTSKELKNRTTHIPNLNLLFLLLVPGINVLFWIFYVWKYSEAIKQLTGFNNIILFVLWLFVSPVGLVISQIQLNKRAI